MHTFIRFCAYMWVYYKVFIIVAIIVAKSISAAHLFMTGYDKWWTAAVPFGHFYYKRDLAGIEMYFLIPCVIFELLWLTSFNLILFLIWLVFSIICNTKYAYVYVSSVNPFIYSCVPFAKYVIMLKESVEYARNESR